jgi:predicted nucleic acid-binding protein
VPKIRVLLDACVLLPYQLADLLLRLADAEMYEPLWSEDILTEVERNLVEKFGVAPEKAARRIGRMQSAFPNASVESYQGLIPAMTTHPKDRHVAAAAVRGGAALIVTANLRDFPPESLSQYDIEVVHPDDFLQDQLGLSHEVTMACLLEQRRAYTRPPLSFTQFYLSLRKTVPNFSDLAVAAEAAAWNPNEPMPLGIVSESEVLQAFFPHGQPEPTDPLGAAYTWWSALLDKAQYFTALQNLTWHPPAWGDYEWAFEWLSNAGIMQFVERCPGADDIVYLKFMPEVEHPMQAFDEALLKHAYILTMVLCSDGLWRAWGLQENYFPRPEEIRKPQQDSAHT